jgi:hypothetical protein
VTGLFDARLEPTARATRGIAICLLAVPAMLVAHLMTARTVPPAGVVVLVTLVAFAVTAAAAPRSRWSLALTVGLAQAAGHALLALLSPVTSTASPRGCLPMVGRGAELGLQLALVRHDATCPLGAVAAGPTTTAALAALLSASLILAVHGVIAALAAALVTAAEFALRTLRSCAALVRPAPALPALPVAAPRMLAAAPSTGRPVRSLWTPHPAQRRGPPRTVTAAAAA